MPRLGFVKMNVDMRLAVMAMPMQVNVRTLTQHPQHRDGSQSDDHQRYAKLQPLGDRRRNGYLKHQDGNADEAEAAHSTRNWTTVLEGLREVVER